VVFGSSPRVWGKEGKRHLQWETSRIIPTRVGKSATRRAGSPQTSDHPHACGEKPVVFEVQDVLDGSSPRVWGKGVLAIAVVFDFRIIPTRVGKRTTSRHS